MTNCPLYVLCFALFCIEQPEYIKIKQLTAAILHSIYMQIFIDFIEYRSSGICRCRVCAIIMCFYFLNSLFAIVSPIFKTKTRALSTIFFCFNWFAANYELLSKTKQKQNKIIPIVYTDCSDRIVIYGVIVRQKQSAFIQ